MTFIAASTQCAFCALAIALPTKATGLPLREIFVRTNVLGHGSRSQGCYIGVLTMYFSIYNQGLQFRWNAKAANHEIICSGESYHNKADCEWAVQLVNGKNNYPVHDHTTPVNAFAGGLRNLASLGINPLNTSGGLLSSMASTTQHRSGLLNAIMRDGVVPQK
jgi:uncharacterized protein YegP (UPF0339 family)